MEVLEAQIQTYGHSTGYQFNLIFKVQKQLPVAPIEEWSIGL
jgi:hypothetical protein